MLIAFVQCTEDVHLPIDNDNEAPGVVTNVQVKNLPGKAVIKYSLPSNEDVLYVKAEYTLNSGLKRVTKSSLYTDSLVCDGFGSVAEYDVILTAVDRSDNAGQPVTVKINPLTPPVITIKETLEMRNTFGGVNISWENESNSPVAVVVMIKDTTNSAEDYLEATTIYTEASQGDYNIRGFNTTTRNFYAYVRDRWENYSDTTVAEITPYFEQELDKNLFSAVILPNDMKMTALWDANGPTLIPKLWDNQIWDAGGRMNGQTGIMPDEYFFTFDLGVEAKLSRFKLQQFMGYNDKYLFYDAQVKEFEIYGTTSFNPDGSWDSWTLIDKYEVTKPSGLPAALWNYTDEDKAAAYAGHDFEIPLEAQNVRYIRMRIVSTWGGLDWASIGEMWFYGQVIQ